MGPRRFTDAVSDLVYEIENLLTGKRKRAHARRLTMYCAYVEGCKGDAGLVEATEINESHIDIAESIRAISSDGGFKCR